MARFPCTPLTLAFVSVVTATCNSLPAGLVAFSSGPQRIMAHLSTPQGAGPFPAVIYLHGGKGPIVGGDPAATAKALAKAGWIGFAPLRGKGLSLNGSARDVVAAINYVKGLKNVDPRRLAIVGFSRGGLLALMASTRRRDLKAVVLLAPAHGRGLLRRVLSDAPRVNAPTLILVSKNDTKQADHLGLCRQINTALKAAAKPTRLVVYPPYRKDGHQLFFKVRSSYWTDVVKFLEPHLKD